MELDPAEGRQKATSLEITTELGPVEGRQRERKGHKPGNHDGTNFFSLNELRTPSAEAVWGKTLLFHIRDLSRRKVIHPARSSSVSSHQRLFGEFFLVSLELQQSGTFELEHPLSKTKGARASLTASHEKVNPNAKPHKYVPPFSKKSATRVCAPHLYSTSYLNMFASYFRNRSAQRVSTTRHQDMSFQLVFTTLLYATSKQQGLSTHYLYNTTRQL